LWIDDDESFIESQSLMFDTLREDIENEGFDLDLQFRTSPDQLDIDSIGNEFDLMVIDYNLTENGPNGDDVIHSIREHDCLTEVIFYSSSGANVLRQHAAEKALDGIFFSSKDVDALRAKVESVFRLTVRKVLDVENMRGLVMAGVADIDHQLTDLLRAVHNKMDEENRRAHRKDLFGKMLFTPGDMKKLVMDNTHAAFDTLKLAIDGVKELEPQEFETLIKSRRFDSNKRVNAVESLCKKIGHLGPYKEAVEKIKDLLSWRNALAHQRPAITDGIHFFSPSEDKPEAFDSDRRKELRKLMRVHRVQLNEAYGKVTS
jgi:DNA-binding NarL/FixJ family response regulator